MPEADTPLIELEQLSRSYGSVQALRDVTLRLEPGTIGLVGNNGAGKSTLLKVMLGLLKPHGGRGSILGCDIGRAASALRGRIGYMPETAAIVPVLKGVEFVTLAGDLYGMPHRDARRRAHEVLNYVGLGELRYRRLEEYSTGNLQRLKLAAALVHDPELLLLDEPTNGLDPSGRRGMLRLIEDLIGETGKSVILCTHLLGDVEQLCRQLVVLDRGTVVLAGSMQMVRSRVAGRYRIAWQGPIEPLCAALQAGGVELIPDSRQPQAAAIKLPPDWSTTRLFQLASDCQAVLTELVPEEEDLQRLFHRLTHKPPPGNGQGPGIKVEMAEHSGEPEA